MSNENRLTLADVAPLPQPDSKELRRLIRRGFAQKVTGHGALSITDKARAEGQASGAEARTLSTEYRLLPRGFNAVIHEVQFSSTDFRFTVQIGRVRYKNPGQLASRDVNLGFTAANYTHIPRGTHAGGMVVLPISDGSSSSEKYEIDIIGTPGGNEAKLGLYVRGARRKLVRERTIDTSKLRELDPNFDLDPTKPDNHGLKLSHPLSQILYDFQIDQEPSKQQGKQSTTRRALRSQPSTKHQSRVSYDLSPIIEAGLEDKLLGLMQDYLKLATALGPQNSVVKLNEQADQEITAYLNSTDTKAKRKMEETLRKQLDHLQTTSFEQTVEMLYRFKKDNGETEEEIGKSLDKLRKKFLSTKANLRNEMLLPLIDLKQKMAVGNFDGYRNAWLALFPTGPRTIYWKKKWEKAEASGDQIMLAEISEGLREELGKKLIAKAREYLEETQTLNIDTGMPADLAEQKLFIQLSEFRSSPLLTKIETLKDFQIGADAAMLPSFPLNIRLWGSIIKDSRDEVITQLNNDFNNASIGEKVRISRNLYRRFKTELDAAIEEYASRFVKSAKDGLEIDHEDIGIIQIKKRFEGLPRSEQLRIITSGEII